MVRELHERHIGKMTVLTALLMLAVILSIHGCSSSEEPTMVVTATAFNSVERQTDADPTIAAWGDTLTPGMKAIAVSRDLLDIGLTHGTRVRIEGLDGEYIVLDKMAARWEKKIDIYMGVDVQAAKQWGKRQVRISWMTVEEDE